MRQVTIPQPLAAISKAEPDLTFQAFVLDALPLIPLGSKTEVELANSLLDKLIDDGETATQAGQVVELTDGEHEALVRLFNAAKARVKGRMLRKLLPFYHAVHGLPDPRG